MSALFCIKNFLPMHWEPVARKWEYNSILNFEVLKIVFFWMHIWKNSREMIRKYHKYKLCLDIFKGLIDQSIRSHSDYVNHKGLKLMHTKKVKKTINRFSAKVLHYHFFFTDKWIFIIVHMLIIICNMVSTNYFAINNITYVMLEWNWGQTNAPLTFCNK